MLAAHTNTFANVTLHAYQSLCVDKAIDLLIREDQPSVLIQSATGSGKTMIAGAMIKILSQALMGTKVLVVLPSMTLVEQFYGTLVDSYGLKVMVLHNELTKDKNGRRFNKTEAANIILTMPETFAGVITGESNLQLPSGWAANFMYMDEAHKNTAASSQGAREFFPLCKIIGLTATPRREQNKDGEHLYSWYGERLVVAATTEQLIDGGFIVAPNIEHLSDKLPIVSEWQARFGDFTNKRTIIICEDTKYAVELEKQFNKVARAQIITAGSEVYGVKTQTYAERQRYFAAFERGEIDVLVSVDSLCEGFDCKCAHILVIARSMTSKALIHQVAGRVLRVFEGKEFGYILDFGNNSELDVIRTKVWTPLDYAPDVSHVVRGVRVTPNALRTGKLAYACDACPHVYDARAHASCTACGTKAEIETSFTVRDFLNQLYGGEIDGAFWKAQKLALEKHMTRVNAVVGGMRFDAWTKSAEEFNVVFRKTVFIPETQKAISPKWSFLDAILKQNLPLDHVIKVSASEFDKVLDLFAE